MSTPTSRAGFWTIASLALSAGLLTPVAHAQKTLLNVSYDVTREFYKDYNPLFAAHWKKTTGQSLTINQSHGGSSKQANSVVEGLEADVITMNQASDIDILASKGKLIPADWAKRLPDSSSPNSSVSVILVRKGNPKGIKDWVDLARPGVAVIIPNPKTSGNGRYTYLAVYGSAIQRGTDASNAKALVRGVFANVPVLDGGGRAATTTFAQRGLGDALVTFESEVPLIKGEFGNDFEVVYPSLTILAENPVSVVDKVVDKKGTRKEAEAYLKYLWSDEGQTVAARHHLRPRSAKVQAQFANAFPKVNTFTVQQAFGGWSKAQQDHFADGALYDQILTARKR
jgi:sulfate transport system substrate-binding protein